MKYCMKCGVVIDEEKNRFCPLCKTIILSDEQIENLSHEQLRVMQEIKTYTKKRKPKKEKKSTMGLAGYVMFLSSFASIINLLIIDFAIGFNIDWSIIPIISIILFVLTVNLPFMKLNKKIYWYITFDTIVLCIYFLLLNYIISINITWSYYVSLSIILLWVYLSTLLVSKIKGFILKIAINFIATALFVLFISLGLNNTSSFSQLVLPINGLVFILTIIFYLFIKTYIYNWRIIISILTFNVSILCLGIDLLIQKYYHGAFFLDWSYIVLIVLIPFTLYMIYLDNTYKIHKYLSKKFHI